MHRLTHDYLQRFRKFAEEHCSRLYLTCDHCKWASLSGCTHPQHPKNKPAQDANLQLPPLRP